VIGAASTMDDEELDQLAIDFDVSALVIRHQIENYRRASLES
jgi:hypothetical protein